MKKRIIIVGAGVAGLSAGCFGQLNGFDTEIFEMHTLPGGLCTAWERKGYIFDGCIHFLMGAKQGSIIHDTWKETGALEGKTFIKHDSIMHIETGNGKRIVLYSDINRLESHLIEVAPEDSGLIREISDAVKKISDLQNAMKPDENDRFKKISCGELVNEFKSSLLRQAFSAFLPEKSRAFALVYQLAMYNNGDACWPVGGSLQFAKSIERRYLELSGKINYGAKVEKILVEDDKAYGIKLFDRTIHTADYVISAADGYSTIYGLLDGRYVNDGINQLFAEGETCPSSVQVSLGLDCDLSAEPSCLNAPFEGSSEGWGISRRLLIKHYCYDPSMAPAGKSTVVLIYNTPYQYWKELSKDRKAYALKKKEVADRLTGAFLDRYPAARGKLEVVDAATPVTYNRYTGVWKGAYSGWRAVRQGTGATLPGLSCFYMAGQWTMPTGGLPTAVMTGRGSIMRILRDQSAVR